MNRISTTSTRNRLQAVSAAVLVALIALTGASWMTLTAPTDVPAVVQLDRVVISGARTPEASDTVEQLPRVVVVGRRDTAGDGMQVASASCKAPAVC